MYPSFTEIENYMKRNPRSSIRDICRRFNQMGDDNVIINTKKLKGYNTILSFGINFEFFKYIRQFLGRKNVIWHDGIIDVLVKDDRIPICNEDEKYIPVVFTIQ